MDDLDDSFVSSGLPEAPKTEPLSESYPPISSTPPENDVGPMCIVISPLIRKQLMRGVPLIVGTSADAVEAFFQRLVALCQADSHMPVMFQTLDGAVTVANIRKKNEKKLKPSVSEPTSKSNPKRYHLPRGNTTKPPDKKPKPTQPDEIFSAAPSATSKVVRKRVKDISKAESDDTSETAQEMLGEAPAPKSHATKNDEIPLEAVRLYLKYQRYGPGWSMTEKRNLRKRAKDFLLDSDGTLLYRAKDGRRLICVEDRRERMDLIWEIHDEKHPKRDAVLEILRRRYYWKSMFRDVVEVITTCPVCAVEREMRVGIIAPTQEEMHPTGSSANADSLDTQTCAAEEYFSEASSGDQLSVTDDCD
ncbi:uncharacterized protein LOC129585655 [Paramacrobiotus metropolitanus]|uniref:uncharacterized protein LOC129585655 n=1 Tax=Paramacrobiotus metropolitanus TaxID=2943436 RepID=UPI0024460E34|nr:uncharacterized protein LOC129585655 [Paramacrobiotus metropolitanus]